MRQVVLDTETTGMDPAQGHRIIEIGCVELVHRRPTGRHFHRYLRPDRAVDLGALEVHGITDAFLADKPTFAEVVEEFLAFVEGAEVIIHNAPFDVGFIDHELQLLGGRYGRLQDHCRVFDTLAHARRLHPGQRNSLDALCRRYGVDNSRRGLHGALLDAQILAEVYLAMTGGQASLLAGLEEAPQAAARARRPRRREGRPPLRVIRAGEEELQAHRRYLQRLEESGREGCLWLRLEGAGEEA